MMDRSLRMDECNSDSEVDISDYTMIALQEFLQETAEKERKIYEAGDLYKTIGENWQLSQFWYDDKTADILSKVAIQVAGNNGRVACVSCPTVFGRLEKIKPSTMETYLFEYDNRFKNIFDNSFIFYDYNNPLDLNQDFHFSFDVVVVDPPYLSLECLEKVSQTVQFLAKDKIILCTGAVMEESAKGLLGLNPCAFQPHHVHNLGNEFRCFANFNFDSFF